MLIIHDDDVLGHAPRGEVHRGEWIDSMESPARVHGILTELRRWDHADFQAPLADAAYQELGQIHCGQYLEFLRTAFERWREERNDGDAIPYVWPTRNNLNDHSETIQAVLGRYASDTATPIMEGTWRAAWASAKVAISAAESLNDGTRTAFGLTRPPGHHASRDVYGGYCFLNNAALATQRLLNKGFQRVGILDLDYHHGNGTQQIFWERGDVFFASLHADPDFEFPYYSGHSNETGANDGAGMNLNFPLPQGTPADTFLDCLQRAIDAMMAVDVRAIVVSLGLDTFAGDPLGTFSLSTEDFAAFGKPLATAGLPTLFLLEGGYATEELGRNLINVLQSFVCQMK